MLYPDVHINDSDIDMNDSIHENMNRGEHIGRNAAQSKLELLKGSGAISITKIVEENEKNTKVMKTKHRKTTPMLVDHNLPAGWKREIVEKVSNTKGHYYTVKILGEGRVFERKSTLEKFLKKNSLSLDPELFDFSVYGKN